MSAPFQPTYLKACAVASLLGWLPVLLAQPMMHGGTLLDEVLVWSGIALGGYCTLELIRRARNGLWISIALSAWLALYVLAIAVGLWYAIPYLPGLFGA